MAGSLGLGWRATNGMPRATHDHIRPELADAIRHRHSLTTKQTAVAPALAFNNEHDLSTRTLCPETRGNCSGPSVVLESAATPKATA